MHTLHLGIATGIVFGFSCLAQTPGKTYPGDANYPCDQDWASLNASIGGNLIKSTLPAAVCYGPDANGTACSAAASIGNSDSLVPANPVLVQNPWWSGDDCVASLTPNGTCELGNYPDYVVAASNAQDVSAAVKFANVHNLRVSVKNTGHDYLGRNLGHGALSIWTYGLQGIDFYDNWAPCSSVNVSERSLERRQLSGITAVAYGAANQFAQVHAAAQNLSVTFVSGAATSVGAGGGWIQSGGHGPLANKYGMGVDNVLEHEVVTLTGDIVIANENSYPDLFYALRGGGGGTFGITTRTTIRTHPKPDPVGAVSINLSPAGTNTSQYAAAFAYWLAQSPNLTDHGITGYPTLAGTTLAGFLTAPGKSNDQVTAFLAPIQQGLLARGANLTVTPLNITDTNQLAEGYTTGTPGLPQPPNVIFGSRLMSREGLQDQAAGTTLMQTILDNGYVLLPYPVLGGQVAANANLSIGLNPAWRSAIMHFIVVDESVSDAITTNITAIRAAHQKIIDVINPVMDPLSVNSGAYLNEANFMEPDPVKTFWGGQDRYNTLLTTKNKYDPQNTLWCSPCVGQEVFNLGSDGKLYLP